MCDFFSENNTKKIENIYIIYIMYIYISYIYRVSYNIAHTLDGGILFQGYIEKD